MSLMEDTVKIRQENVEDLPSDVFTYVKSGVSLYRASHEDLTNL